MTAQVLTVFATFVSWIWWVAFTINAIGLVLFQLLWCVRLRTGMMYSHVGVATLASLASLGVGIYCFVVWSQVTECYVFTMDSYTADDDWNDDWPDKVPHYWDDDLWTDDIWGEHLWEGILWDGPTRADYCPEEIWGSISLVCAFLWAVVAICMAYFVQSGRHAQWEALHSSSSSDATTPKEDEQSVATDASASSDSSAGTTTGKDENA